MKDERQAESQQGEPVFMEEQHLWKTSTSEVVSEGDTPPAQVISYTLY